MLTIVFRHVGETLSKMQRVIWMSGSLVLTHICPLGLFMDVLAFLLSMFMMAINAEMYVCMVIDE